MPSLYRPSFPKANLSQRRLREIVKDLLDSVLRSRKRKVLLLRTRTQSMHSRYSGVLGVLGVFRNTVVLVLRSTTGRVSAE
jgi:hypothetical protein